MKRKVAILLAGLMAVGSVLIGCGSSEGTSNDSAAGKDNTAMEGSREASEQGDLEHIVVTYLYQTATPQDLTKVQDAVNEITIPAINVEVEFKPLGFGDSFTNYSLWISSGETVDLMMVAFQDIKNYTNSGQIESLDTLITPENTPTIYELSQEFPIITKVADEIYGLTPVGINYGEKPGLVIRKEWLEETDYKQKDIYTVDDLTSIFAQMKEKHPDTYPLGVRGGDVMVGSSLYSTLMSCEYPGGNVNAGTLMDKDSKTVVNLFETKEYKSFLAQMAAWYSAGYTVPDAATTDTTNNEMIMSGKTGSYLLAQKPEQFMVDYGFEVVGLPTAPGRMGASNSNINWTIPVTSENPEAAIRFMEYMYSNSAVSQLITNGIEGEHYVVEDVENGVIGFPEGVDGTNSPYYNTLGFWGDRRTEYTFDAAATRKEHDIFTEECMSNKYQNYGFTFDSTAVSSQMLACQSVLDQYQKALETGSLGEGWEDTYNTMANQLENAGIKQVIDECQSQLDTFLATK